MLHDAMHEISATRDICGRQGYRFWRSRRVLVVRGIRAGFKIGHRHKAIINAFLDLRAMSRFPPQRVGRLVDTVEDSRR